MIYRRPRARQPQHLVPIDKGNPLAAGLEMFFGWGGAQLVDATNGARVISTAGSFTPDPRGIVRSNARSAYLETSRNYTKTATNQAISIAVWIKPSNSDTGLDAIIRVGRAGVDGEQIAIYDNVTAGGSIYVGTYGNDVYTPSSVCPVGEWACVVVSFDGSGQFSTSTVKVWVNGALQSLSSAGTVKNVDFTDNVSVYIGADDTPGREFRGLIGPVGIWSRGLIAEDESRFRINPWQVYAPLPRRLVQPSAATSFHRGGVVALLMG